MDEAARAGSQRVLALLRPRMTSPNIVTDGERRVTDDTPTRSTALFDPVLSRY